MTFPTDVLQLIGNYLGSIDFYKLKNLCNLSVDNYIKNIHIKVNNHHEYMDDLIKRNLIKNIDVIHYATQYDIPKYAYLTMYNGVIWIKYKNAGSRPIIWQFNTIPKIVEHSYKYYKFRFDQEHLDNIFENDQVELMKIVQNYPQKSRLSIWNYYALSCNNLWQLNYKHQIVHLMSKHRTCFYYLTCVSFGLFTGRALRVCEQLLGVNERMNLYILIPLCIGLGVLNMCIIDRIVEACVNLKLPL